MDISFTNSNFTDITVALDNIVYDSCIFLRCRMVYSGVGNFNVRNSTFDECTFVLTGPALNTYHFLRSVILQSGGPELFETFFPGVICLQPGA